MSLTKQEIAEFRTRLLELYRKLAGFMRENNADVTKPDDSKGYSQHQADEGTDDFDRTIKLELSDKELKTLRQIERALEKIDENTYGICDVTGDEIPKKRLDAIPYATMTVVAQDKLEKGLL